MNQNHRAALTQVLRNGGYWSLPARVVRKRATLFNLTAHEFRALFHCGMIVIGAKGPEHPDVQDSLDVEFEWREGVDRDEARAAVRTLDAMQDARLWDSRLNNDGTPA